MPKTFKFKFSAYLGEFSLKANNMNIPVFVTWKRSSEVCTSTPVKLEGGNANIHQTLHLPVNMYYDTEKQLFLEKKTMLTFILQSPKGEKQAGVVYLYLEKLLNQKLESMENTYVLQKCPINNSTIFICLSAQNLGQTSNDTMSECSVNVLPISSISSEMISNQQNTTNKTDNEKAESAEVTMLRQKVQKLIKEKENMERQLEKYKTVKSPKGETELQIELTKCKEYQAKLQSELQNLHQENARHAKDLQKMRINMEQIYQLFNRNLSNLI